MRDTNDDRAKGFGRRDFGRMLAFGGPAVLASRGLLAATPQAPSAAIQALPATPAKPDEAYWRSVRALFAMPADLAVLNAANLCPASTPVIDAYTRATRVIDVDPSMDNRRQLGEGREAARRSLASFLGVTPEEILITRNTSEGNNIVSSGVELKAGDEVVLLSDNHPSAHLAFREKAKRFGFTVKIVDLASPHPGTDYYVDAFSRAITPATRLIALTHVTASSGDVLPVGEICRMARGRGVLTLVDAAQSFGILNSNLAEMQPDFFTGSAHKWPCGPREIGVLYVNKLAQPKLWPHIISLYSGAVGISKTHGALGQRDEAAMIGFGEALALQNKIGRGVVEARSRALATRLVEGLRAIDGVTLWTSPDPTRRAAIVSFKPGKVDPSKLVASLYAKERIACTSRGGGDRGGVRLSPHFYNLEAEIDRTLDAIRRYIAKG